MQLLKEERSGKHLTVEVIDESSSGLDSHVRYQPQNRSLATVIRLLSCHRRTRDFTFEGVSMGWWI